MKKPEHFPQKTTSCLSRPLHMRSRSGTGCSEPICSFMTELDICVIYLQNIQRHKHKYTSMSCPRVHTARARYAHFSRAAATREKQNTISFNVRQVSRQGALKSRDLTLRDLTKRHHIARVDIARPDKALKIFFSPENTVE